MLKVAYFIEKECTLKDAYLIEQGATDFGFKQFEHAQVKGEWARGVRRKLCVRKYFSQFEKDLHKRFRRGKGAGTRILFLKEGACALDLLLKEKGGRLEFVALGGGGGCAPRTCCRRRRADAWNLLLPEGVCT